jgi:phage N-6-adenine-methyltransferase
MSMPAQKPHRSKQDYATPSNFITATKALLKIDAFTFDFAANLDNRKAPRYWSEQDDSLSKTPKQWAAKIKTGWGWLNPPFADITPWAKRCAQTRAHGGSIAFLIPAAVGANWFRDHVDGHAMVLVLNGRLAFMPDHPRALYPKDCILALYGPHVMPGYLVWSWKDKKALRAA